MESSALPRSGLPGPAAQPPGGGGSGAIWQAIILSGGRATRLDGADKAELIGPDGRTCLDRVIGACRSAARRVVVGPVGADPRVEWTREEPAYSGPARAIAAGMAVLARGADGGDADRVAEGLGHVDWGADGVPHTDGFGTVKPEGPMTWDEGGDGWVIVLACDMPYIGDAVPGLLAAAGQAPADVDGIVGVDDAGSRQWLCAAYRAPALALACAGLARGGAGESVRSLVGELALAEYALPGRAARDIDTPAEMRALGFAVAGAGGERTAGVPESAGAY